MHAKEVLRRDRLKAIKDGENRGLARGIIEGKKEGIKEGRMEGKKEGIKEGIKEGKLSIAKKMLEENIDIIFIAKVTGLSRREIEKL